MMHENGRHLGYFCNQLLPEQLDQSLWGGETDPQERVKRAEVGIWWSHC